MMVPLARYLREDCEPPTRDLTHHPIFDHLYLLAILLYWLALHWPTTTHRPGSIASVHHRLVLVHSMLHSSQMLAINFVGQWKILMTLNPAGDIFYPELEEKHYTVTPFTLFCSPSFSPPLKNFFFVTDQAHSADTFSNGSIFITPFPWSHSNTFTTFHVVVVVAPLQCTFRNSTITAPRDHPLKDFRSKHLLW